MGFTALLLDQNADGTYTDHGADVVSLNVHRGCRSAAQRWPTPSISGGSAVVVGNDLDPDTGAPYGPYPAVVQGAAVTLWSGTAEWVGVDVVRGQRRHTLRLRDSSFDALQRIVTIERAAGTLAGLLTDFTAQSSVPVAVPDSTLKVGAISWRGPALAFLDELARFIGGWALTTSTGWRIVSPKDVVDSASAIGVTVAPEEGSGLAQALGWRAGWVSIGGATRTNPLVITLDGALPQARMPDWATNTDADTAPTVWKWLPVRAGRPRVASLAWTLTRPADATGIAPALNIGTALEVSSPVLGVDPVLLLPLEASIAGDAAALTAQVTAWQVFEPPAPNRTLSITARTQSSITWTLDIPGGATGSWNWAITRGTTAIASGTLDATAMRWQRQQTGLALGTQYTLTITRGPGGPKLAESTGYSLNDEGIPGPLAAPGLTSVTLEVGTSATWTTAPVSSPLTTNRLWTPATASRTQMRASGGDNPKSGPYALTVVASSPTATVEILAAANYSRNRSIDTAGRMDYQRWQGAQYYWRFQRVGGSWASIDMGKTLEIIVTDAGKMRTYYTNALMETGEPPPIT